MREVDRAIAKQAAGQHGLITRAQAHGLGASDRMISRRVRTGGWERVDRGVYRLAEYPASWKSGVLAACLLHGPHAHASHRSAAALRTLGDVAPGAHTELIIRRGHARPRPGMILYGIAESLHPADVEIVHGIPATAPARTLFDLAGVLSVDVVEEALDDALTRGLVTPARLRWQLTKESRRGRAGIRVMRALLADRGVGAPLHESVLETRLARELRAAGIEGLERQHEIRDGDFLARVDFAIPHLKIAIEADGYRWHAGRARWERDLARRNALTALGWHVLHVTARDLDDGATHLIRALRRVIAARGG